MSASITVRKRNDFQTSKWSGGMTTQLFIYPETAEYKAGNFQARISSATVEAEKSEFTSLPGVKRYLMIFNGHLRMVHGKETAVELEPYEVDAFDGGIPTVSQGRVTDFNLMLKNGCDGKMEAACIRQGENLRLDPKGQYDLLVVLVKEGRLSVQGKTAEAGELLLCESWEEALLFKNESGDLSKAGICKIKTAG